jgi:hypothetical protein
MEFRILGPLEVLGDGRELDLGGSKQRALLTILLLHANEVVSQDRLIEALWEDEPPETAQKRCSLGRIRFGRCSRRRPGGSDGGGSSRPRVRGSRSGGA